MKSYQYERIRFEYFGRSYEDLGRSENYEDYRQIIDRMAAEGFEYKGYIPVKYKNGMIKEIDLIFEIDC